MSHGWARWLSPIFLCRRIELAPHTAVIVFGKEFFWSVSSPSHSHSHSHFHPHSHSHSHSHTYTPLGYVRELLTLAVFFVAGSISYPLGRSLFRLFFPRGGSLQRMDHEAFVEEYGSGPVEIIDMGETSIDQALFNDFLLSISSRYTTKQYDILNNNCEGGLLTPRPLSRMARAFIRILHPLTPPPHAPVCLPARQ